MDKKQIRNLAILAALLIICIISYFSLKGANEKSDADAEIEKTALSTLSANGIDEISYIVDDKKVRLSKKDGIWYVGSVSINSVKVSAMTSAISSLEASREIGGEDVKLSEYGLIEPSNVITASGNGTQMKITIGDINSMTDEYYIYLGDDTDKVYTIDSVFVSNFRTSSEDLTEN